MISNLIEIEMVLELCIPDSLCSTYNLCCNHRIKRELCIAVDSLPLNVWYMETVLRAALVNARGIHAKMSNGERNALKDKFNDSESDLQVFIITYSLSLGWV